MVRPQRVEDVQDHQPGRLRHVHDCPVVDHGTNGIIEFSDAVMVACQQRMGPILLTTATTVLGMTPLLWGGTAMFKTMAITIIFGLAFATALTLLVVPVMYSMFFRVSFGKSA